MPQRQLDTRPQLGSTGNIIQHSKLLYSRLALLEPSMIFIRRGCKHLRWAKGELLVSAGQMVAVAGNQTFDVINEPDENELYEAQWISFDQAVVERFADQYGTGAAIADAALLGRNDKASASFEHAAWALSQADMPAAVTETALHSLLAWLLHQGWGFTVYERISLVRQIRKMIAADTAQAWTAAQAAQQLNMSEPTLRRQLAQQNTSFRQLLTDVRMMRALTLLQVTDWPIAHIAGEAGYHSASRFAARFKQRFGFPPSAVRAAGATNAASYRRDGRITIP